MKMPSLSELLGAKMDQFDAVHCGVLKFADSREPGFIIIRQYPSCSRVASKRPDDLSWVWKVDCLPYLAGDQDELNCLICQKLHI